MAEAGVVALIAVVVAVFDLIPVGTIPLGARLALWLAGFLAAWLVYLAAARVGIAVARLMGLADYWGHALAVPFVGLAVTYGAHPHDHLLEHAPLACFDDVAGLERWLLANG